MTIVTILLIVLGVLLSTIIFAVVMSAVLRALAEGVERVRVEREAAEASWEIYARANQTFGELLDAAREQKRWESR